MCSNYTPSRRPQLAGYFGVEAPPEAGFETEAYPSYSAPIIRPQQSGDPDFARECVAACFGMVPHWADLKLAKHTYNARSETVAAKPSFRHAYRHRQFCIVPAESFFEPSYESGSAVRWRIEAADGHPLGIAGIWESRSGGPNEPPLLSFSMLTINADDHPLMRRFHRPDDEKRMLVLLRPEDFDSWLHAPLEQVPSFLTPFPADRLIASAAPKPPRKKAPKPAPVKGSGSLFI